MSQAVDNFPQAALPFDEDASPAAAGTPLPAPLTAWFAGRGWQPHAHQLAVLAQARAGRSVLAIAPTGGGKTLAGFLPSLAELIESPDRADRPGGRDLHTLYISPLKALAVDVARNLEIPVGEMGLDLRIETRSGDTKASKRSRQRVAPPDILMTTPEQLALLLSFPDAPRFFRALRWLVLDELHALAHSKRGELLSLGMARLARLAPGHRRIGLSATVAEPARLQRFLDPAGNASLVRTGGGAMPEITILASDAHVPWSGHTARHAYGEIYAAIRQARISLVFVNTRSQAELVFQSLWHLNEDNLPIALHHGSLEKEQRRKVEAAMARGSLRAVVCTSTLDLGIDWGDVDLVIQLGAPKGISRTLQRIGRSNHRMAEASRALLVPANRFEVLECRAAVQAVGDGQLDGEQPRAGGYDVLAQHLLGMACSGPFDADAQFAETRAAAPYAGLDRATFDKVLGYVADGGYALRAYDRYRRLRQQEDGRWTVTGKHVLRQYRMNAGTIVEAPKIKVRLRGGRNLGEVEEGFIEQLVPGDTFVFAGQVLRFEGLREMAAIVTRAPAEDPAIPSYDGGKFPLSTFLAGRVRQLLADWRKARLPAQVRDWLRMQELRSVLPRPSQLLVESFPRGRRHYLVAYPFEGRLAHQTLGMLLTRRMERAGLRPMGFVASEYAMAAWSLRPVAGAGQVAALFHEDMLGDDLESWLAESALLKRTFRNVGVIAGLIERRHPGQEKSGKQVTVSSDLIYDVLRRYEPDHILLQATRADAATGLLDIGRLGDMLRRVQGRILFKSLDRVSPLAVPVMLEIGKEPVLGPATMDDLLGEASEALIEEACRLL